MHKTIDPLHYLSRFRNRIILAQLWKSFNPIPNYDASYQIWPRSSAAVWAKGTHTIIVWHGLIIMRRILPIYGRSGLYAYKGSRKSWLPLVYISSPLSLILLRPMLRAKPQLHIISRSSVYSNRFKIASGCAGNQFIWRCLTIDSLYGPRQIRTQWENVHVLFTIAIKNQRLCLWNLSQKKGGRCWVKIRQNHLDFSLSVRRDFTAYRGSTVWFLRMVASPLQQYII